MYLPTAIATLILAAATATPPTEVALAVPQVKPAEHDVRPGRGVTRVARLQDYLPALAGTAGDTAVYVLQGAKPGGVVSNLPASDSGSANVMPREVKPCCVRLSAHNKG